jgi:chromate transporter
MSQNQSPAASASSVSPLRETAQYFMRLGITGFGGPLAVVATMQKDLVETRGWLTEDEFARAFALIKAMPGPVAFQTAVYVGRRHAGLWGGAAAAFGIVFPAFVLMVLFGAFLANVEGLAPVTAFLEGMQAAALGLILASTKGLFWPYRKKIEFWLLAALAAGLTFYRPSWEPLAIIGLGVAVTLVYEVKKRGLHKQHMFLTGLALPSFLLGDPSSSAVARAGSIPAALGDLAWVSFKAGALVFGSGIAIVPLLEQDFVARLGWLTHGEFMNALAFGQVTPGPVVITATFIGYKALGLTGAIVGTACVFGAPFFHMMTWFPPLVGRLARLTWIPAFLTGAIAAVVGAILATSIKLALPFAASPLLIALIIAALVAALFSKLPAWSVIPLGGAIALLARWLF